MLERLVQYVTMELGEEHAKQVIKDREVFTKQVPFVSAVSAGLREIGYSSLEEALKDIPHQNLLTWLSWRYSLLVNPSIAMQDNSSRETPLSRSVTGVYVIDDSKLSSLVPPSGFEGYFVGNVDKPDLIAKVILGLPSKHFAQLSLSTHLNSKEVAKYIGMLGALELQTIRQLNKYSDPSRVSHIFRILTSNAISSVQDLPVLVELDAVFGSMVGRMRAILNGNKEGQFWQKQTHDAVEQYVRSVAYLAIEDRIDEKFILPPKLTRPNQFGPEQPAWSDLPTSFNISPDEGNPSYLNIREGYAFASLIGKLGNPLIRRSMPGIKRLASSVHY